MQPDIYNHLHDEGIYPYGSAELHLFEKQLTKYFSREYALHNNNDANKVVINKGPLALAAEELAEQHYDEGLDFFKSFLDRETMSYTMAYFDDDPIKALSSTKTLTEAQTDKFKLIAKRMKLKGDEYLLNMGSGFGYFESYLLDVYPDLKIVSTTHSKTQYDYIVKRIENPSDTLSSSRFSVFFVELDHNITNLLGAGKYDLVCSMGLLEQIHNIEQLFGIINELLGDNGRMFHHLIVSRDLIPQLLDSEKTLIGKYFPGGKVFPFKTLQNDFKNFKLEHSWFINGCNYWKTLDAWHANFWKNLQTIYPKTMDIDRVKYWNNYFVLCKAMFLPEHGTAYGNGQYLFRKV